MSLTTCWIAAALGLLLGGGCAALLGALRGASRHKLARVYRDERRRTRILALLEEQRRWVFAAIVLRTSGFALAAFGISAPIVAAHPQEPLAFLEAALLSIVTLVLADTVPRALGDAWAERVLLAILPPFAVLARALSPALAVPGIVSWLALRMSGVEPETDREEIADSLRSAALEGVSEGLLDPSATRLIDNALRFADREVRDVMTPRTEVVAVSASAPLPDVVKLLASTKLTRIPVYEETLDQVVGVFYAKDLLAQDLLEGGVRGVMRKPAFVPETKKLSELLREFRRGQPHLMIVVDEHGGTAGIVTLEDVIEEILGDIRDEDDEPEGPLIRKIGDGDYELKGGVRVGDLNLELGVHIPDDPDYETVAGFVTTALGRIPQKGEVLAQNGLRFVVLDADERKVKRLRLVVKV